MPSQRDKSKRLVGFFADQKEKAGLQKLARSHDCTVAELLRRISNGTIKLTVKVAALSALMQYIGPA